MIPEPDRAEIVEVNRCPLRLWEWGDPSAPTVVMVHGGFDHGRMLDDLAARMAARGHHVVAIDIRGHGDSGGLYGGHVFTATVIDIGVLASRYGRVGLVGHSLGGSMVMRAAGIWPEHVDWVVSLDGLGPPDASFDEWPEIDEAARQSLDYGIKILRRGRRVFADEAAMAEQRGAINTRLPKPWLDHLVRHGSRPVEGGFVWKFDPLFNVGFHDGFSVDWVHHDLMGNRAPTLVLTGTELDMWSEMGQDEIDGRIALLENGRHHFISGAGHYVHLEEPEQTCARIDEFLEEVRA